MRRARNIVLSLALAGVATPPAVAQSVGPDQGSVLVKMRPGTGPGDRAAVGEALDAGRPAPLPGGWLEYPVDSPVTAGAARRALGATRDVAAVDVPLRVAPAGVTNDPILASGQQWGLLNTGVGGGTAGIDIGATTAWDATRARGRVVVAVIDTGVRVTHPDLAGSIWTNPGEVPGNGVDDDGNGFVDDVNGWDFLNDDASVYDDPTQDEHGTHVAGIVAARADNGIGIAGVAPNAVVMPLKFMDTTGGFNTDAVAAIRYAVDNGATVINASFGGDTPDALMCDAIQWAASRGVTVVSAAGNAGRDITAQPVWPAACTEPSMLTVTAVDASGGLPGFANRSSTLVDTAAPGARIASTVPGGYSYMNGTSMAAPAVAGAAAVVRGEGLATTPAAVRNLLLGSVRPLPSLAGATVSGGMVSMSRALSVPQAPADTTAPDAPPVTTPATGAMTDSNDVTIRWNASTAPDVAGYELVIDGTTVGTTTGLGANVFAADGPHSVRVRAVDAAGNAAEGPTATFTVDATAPTTPRVRGVKTTGSAIVIRWTAAQDVGSGVARYDVLMNGTTRRVAAAGATSATIRTAGRSGKVVVRAVDRAGNSATSSVARTPTVTVRAITSKGRRAARVTARVRSKVRLAAVRRGRSVATATLVVPKGTTKVRLARALESSVSRGAALRVTSAETLGR